MKKEAPFFNKESSIRFFRLWKVWYYSSFIFCIFITIFVLLKILEYYKKRSGLSCYPNLCITFNTNNIVTPTDTLSNKTHINANFTEGSEQVESDTNGNSRAQHYSEQI